MIHYFGLKNAFYTREISFIQESHCAKWSGKKITWCFCIIDWCNTLLIGWAYSFYHTKSWIIRTRRCTDEAWRTDRFNDERQNTFQFFLPGLKDQSYQGIGGLIYWIFLWCGDLILSGCQTALPPQYAFSLPLLKKSGRENKMSKLRGWHKDSLMRKARAAHRSKAK